MTTHDGISLWRYGSEPGLHMRATGPEARRALAEAISALRPEVEDAQVGFGTGVADAAGGAAGGDRRFVSEATLTIGSAEVTDERSIGLPDGFAEILDEGVAEGHDMTVPVDTAHGTETLRLWWDA